VVNSFVARPMSRRSGTVITPGIASYLEMRTMR
jgi:hypothetical protein